MSAHKKLLIIAGSDSSGGAGIQADIKTACAFGVFATTAITAVTVQNTQGVSDIHPIPAHIVAGQIDAVLSDIGADAIKIGMLHNAKIIHAVADILANHPNIPIILDPVMLATSGAKLLENDAKSALTERLFPLASLITPNLPEAEALLGTTAKNSDDAASQLIQKFNRAVLVKGGHSDDDNLVDTLITQNSRHHYSAKRIQTRNSHGTGCTLASAIACGIAKGQALFDATKHAHAYVQNAIKSAPNLGSGNGPINHLT